MRTGDAGLLPAGRSKSVPVLALGDQGGEGEVSLTPTASLRLHELAVGFPRLDVFAVGPVPDSDANVLSHRLDPEEAKLGLVELDHPSHHEAARAVAGLPQRGEDHGEVGRRRGRGGEALGRRRRRCRQVQHAHWS